MFKDQIQNIIEWMMLDYNATVTILTLLIYAIFTIFIIKNGGSIWAFIIGYLVLSAILELFGFSSSINIVTILVNFLKDIIKNISLTRMMVTLLLILILYVLGLFLAYRFKIYWINYACALLWFIPLTVFDNMWVKIFSIIMLIATIFFTYNNNKGGNEY